MQFSRPPSRRRLSLRRIIMLTIACACASAAAPLFANARMLDWNRFSPPGGRFIIRLPGTPSEEQKTEETPVGDIETTRYVVRTEGVTFGAGYADIPGLIVIFGGRKRIYERIIEEYLKRAEGKELSVTPFRLDAYRGRILTYDSPKRYGKVLMLLVGRRAYLIMCSVPRSSTKVRKIIEQYLDGFQPLYRKARDPHTIGRGTRRHHR